ncbi:MAG: 4'-phosphopantetheinyl transferase family protein [Limisphaerales bacterium]
MNRSPDITLPEHEVHLWTETLTRESPTVADAKQLLSPAEKTRADRFIRKVDHDRFVISHALVRTILSQYLGISPADLTFTTDQFGKPHLDPSINPARLNFNLSHSGDRMILGIVRHARIGVDIEEIRPESARLDVAARFFTAQENEDLRSLAGDDQILGFFNCWTRKEAYLKAIGCGLSASPTDCEVTLKPTDKPQIKRQLPIENQESTWSLFHFSAPSYTSAIALDVPTPILKLKSG